ncbi:MAG: acetyltransferase [Psychrosphaera sp.]|nr:acetyltransferase [Psychrosphaera sp.]
MVKLAILGAGGHGKVVADAALASGKWTDIIFFDDGYPEKKSIGPWSIGGDFQALVDASHSYTGIVVAIGNNKIRLEKQQEVSRLGGRIISVIHPDASISPYAYIGAGSVVMAGAVVNPFAKIGAACIINSNCVVEHDCSLADAVHISPGSLIAGGVSIGARAWIGIGSCVRQSIQIGAGVVTGAGSVVVKDITVPGVYVGNPATELIKAP